MEEPFKKCPNCFHEWETQAHFLEDKSIHLIGYKADLKKIEYGLFFFNHNQEKCHSTMAIEAKDFFNLYEGPKYNEKKTGSEDCKGYCKETDNLNRCEAMCENAFVREVIQKLKDLRQSHQRSKQQKKIL